MKTKRDVPIVFRIRNNPALRSALMEYANHESRKTGYRITPAEVCERAIREWLADKWGPGTVRDAKP
jgi:hypothetical protein